MREGAPGGSYGTADERHLLCRAVFSAGVPLPGRLAFWIGALPDDAANGGVDQPEGRLADLVGHRHGDLLRAPLSADAAVLGIQWD
jgi:hypothetical protein